MLKDEFNNFSICKVKPPVGAKVGCLFLCLNQSKVAAKGIMLSDCPFVPCCQIVRLFFCLFARVLSHL